MRPGLEPPPFPENDMVDRDANVVERDLMLPGRCTVVTEKEHGASEFDARRFLRDQDH